jgi:hypothetical protein
MIDTREYVVTLKRKDDLDCFYEDMESNIISDCVPCRSVECVDRRPISRNTHYRLTDEEAEVLKNDNRVETVELTLEEQGIIIEPFFTQEEIDNWNKSQTQNSNHKNWGLLRAYNGQQITDWGSNGTPQQSGTVVVNAEGRNVDVIVVDGHVNPDHPEYAVNSDGTGGSKVIQYNWLELNPLVTGGSAGNYIYPPYTGDNNNHGAHVMGTIIGNTQGWARKANVYHMSPYGDNPNSGFTTRLWDYIRAFHLSKPVNPNTGRKNPTVTNHSYGSVFSSINLTTLASGITSITFRGQTFNGPFTASQIANDFGIVPIFGSTNVRLGSRNAAVEADIQDAIDDGIIVIGAAGNSSFKIDIEGGQDYNNSFIYQGSTFFYHRGSSPSSAERFICVGSVNNLVNDSKSTFSNCGPRVDVYSPGSFIQSSMNTLNAFGVSTPPDPRNSSFYIGKISGTSMASPQVCGILACALEIYPNMKQENAIDYIYKSASKAGQVFDGDDGFNNGVNLLGSENRYAFFKQERPEEGKVFPKKDYFVRPDTGVVYPRTRIRRK